MKGLAITSKGLEQTASMEIKELIGAECKAEECCVIFDFEKFEDMCLLCYKLQSVDRIAYLIGSFEFRDFFAELEKFIEKLNFDDWVLKNKNFSVECIRHGTHQFKSVEVEEKAALLIKKKFIHKKAKLERRNPDIILFFFISGSKCHFGVDFGGFELNKRGYKIYLHSGSLRGTIAYALLRESGLGKKEAVLDPFSRDGVIAIEAAFYANGFPHNYFKKERFAFLKLDLSIDYEKFFKKIDGRAAKKPKSKIYCFDHLFKFVDFSKKNAKIAGVDKLMEFSRTELEWLDIKFRKASIDRIATNPPISKNANLDKIYNEFFYQADYILKKEGRISLISTMADFIVKHAEKHNFAVDKQKDVWSGEQRLQIIVFKKKT